MEGARPPARSAASAAAVQRHRASIFFWQWSHWFHLCGTTAPPSFSGNGAIGSTCAVPPRLHLFSGNGAIGSSCAAYCLLHTSVRCRVNKHLSQCSRVTGMRAGALYQSFFSTIWNYSRNGGRERELNYLFFISLSLSLPLSPPLSLTHTYARGLENIMNN